MAEMPSIAEPVEKPVAELISDPINDPIAEAVLARFVVPATAQFAESRPDAPYADMAAAAALYTFIGVSLVRLARLTSGLDRARQLPDTTGLFASDFKFLPTELDTPYSRAAVAAAFSSGALMRPTVTTPVSEPVVTPVSTPDPGQYL